MGNRTLPGVLLTLLHPHAIVSQLLCHQPASSPHGSQNLADRASAPTWILSTKLLMQPQSCPGRTGRNVRYTILELRPIYYIMLNIVLYQSVCIFKNKSYNSIANYVALDLCTCTKSINFLKVNAKIQQILKLCFGLSSFLIYQKLKKGNGLKPLLSERPCPGQHSGQAALRGPRTVDFWA